MKTMITRLAAAAALVALAAPGIASAHSFGVMYNLPVPFWLYAYGAGAALILSFLVVGYFASAPDAGATSAGRDLGDAGWVRALRRRHAVPALRGVSVFCLLLCMATGFWGNINPYLNFNMTFFWIMFVLGFAYLTALVGDLYAAINPWKVLAQGVDRAWAGYTRGRYPYPAALSYWPALLFYMGFIWSELFGHTRPFSLAALLAGYTAMNLIGVWLVGSAAWFRHCEFFGVFLRLTALMSPLAYEPAAQPGGRGRLRLRAPFTGLLEQRMESWSLLIFLLFMLSSTAFDGLRSTAPWVKLFWRDPFGILTALLGKPPVMAFMQLRPWYLLYESLCLLLSPFLYLAVYLVFVALMKRLTRSTLPVRDLALRFGLSLLPIALVYNITHYFTLILTQGVTIVSLLSDPFGWGWNLFGTAGRFRAPILPNMGLVWHSQVGLIVFGHIVSVWLAHLEALRLWPDRRQAAWSQLPMLVLMVLFTVAGLWILSQPIQAGM